MSATTAEPRLTIDEFLKQHGGELGVELVKGRVVRWPMPGARHGFVCLTAGSIIRDFVVGQKLGRVMSNDTFVKIRPDPDGTLRGGDVCYWSYAKLPREARSPEGVIEAPPELVVEVLSPTNRWSEMYAKIGDYLSAGVLVVVVLDQRTESASVYRPDEFQQVFHNGDEVVLPDVLPGFAVPVKRFFEE
jgi:Uma2 family endonuclease